MATPPTLVAEYESAWNTGTSPKTVSVAVQAGDWIVVGVMSSLPTSTVFSAPTGGTGFVQTDGTTPGWTRLQLESDADVGNAAVYAAKATSGQTFTLSVACDSGGEVWGFDATVWRGSDGIGASAKGSNSAGGAPSLALTTLAANSAVLTWVSDWNESGIGSRAWRTINGITPTASNGDELAATRVSGSYTVFAAYWPDAGAAGAKTTGMTAPANQAYGMVSVEVKGASSTAQLVAGDLAVTATGAGAVAVAAVAGGVLAVTASRDGAVAVAAVAGGSRAVTAAITGTLVTNRQSNLDGGLQVAVVIDGSLLAVRAIPTVVLPAGVVPVRSLTTDEILTGNRSTSFRLELLSSREASKGTLTGVLGGSLDWIANATVKGGGSITVCDLGQSVDWLNDRVRPVITIDGVGEFPQGVFLASEAPDTWSDTGRTWAVKLLDKTAIPDQDAVESTYALDAGTVITDAVADLLASTGETNVAITPSSATLSGPLVWDPGTTKLRIINDLLAAANYFSLYCDEQGQYRAEPYVRPAARPITWEFLDGEQAIYAPDFTRDVDLFGIPNRVIAVGQGDATNPALTSTATNEDPLSPYSFPSRGRWITRTLTGVEAADQSTLDDYARRRLIELTSPTASVDVQHAYVPGLPINAAVRLRRVPAGIDARHVVTRTEVTLDGTALVKSTLTEVVDL